MKWRGQGILTVAVLGFAVIYGVQWHSSANLQQAINSSGLPIQPYTQLVSEYVDTSHHWPTPNELTLPTPPADSVIRHVTLGDNGVLTFTLAGWTFRGRVTTTFAPRLMTRPDYPAAVRLSYACVDVQPAAYEQVVCKQWPLEPIASVNTDNQGAFETWQSNLQQIDDQQRTFADAKNTTTECEQIASRISDNVMDCIARVAPELFGNFAELITTRLRDRPHLRGEVITADPATLVNYNQECKNEWASIRARTIAAQAETSECLSAVL
jgi:hypothetical protein